MQKLGRLFFALMVACLLGQPGLAADCDLMYTQQAKEIRQEYAKFVKRANITIEQQERLRVIKQTTAQHIAPLSQTIAQKQRELVQVIFSTGATQDMAEQLTDEISKLRSQIARLKLCALRQARDVMTPEQQQQFAAFHERLMTSLADKYPGCQQFLYNTVY